MRHARFMEGIASTVCILDTASKEANLGAIGEGWWIRAVLSGETLEVTSDKGH